MGLWDLKDGFLGVLQQTWKHGKKVIPYAGPALTAYDFVKGGIREPDEHDPNGVRTPFGGDAGTDVKELRELLVPNYRDPGETLTPRQAERLDRLGALEDGEPARDEETRALLRKWHDGFLGGRDDGWEQTFRAHQERLGTR